MSTNTNISWPLVREDLRLKVQEDLIKLKSQHEKLKEKVREAVETFLQSEPYLVYIDSVEEAICIKMRKLQELVK